jgi:hypothetical protein
VQTQQPKRCGDWRRRREKYLRESDRHVELVQEGYECGASSKDWAVIVGHGERRALARYALGARLFLVRTNVPTPRSGANREHDRPMAGQGPTRLASMASSSFPEGRNEVIFEKYEVADVSTGYLKESDLPLLLQIDCPTRIAETDGGFGTFHRVSDDDQLFEEDLQNASSFGLSGRFVSIMRHLRAAKIPCVRFDADGGEIRGVERTDATPERKERRAERDNRLERGGSTT